MGGLQDVEQTAPPHTHPLIQSDTSHSILSNKAVKAQKINLWILLSGGKWNQSETSVLPQLAPLANIKAGAIRGKY